jgi:Bacterial protein of unknown function (YtfJ_HI0045)
MKTQSAVGRVSIVAALGSAVLLGPIAVSAGEPPAVLDAKVTRSSGEAAQLKSYWGKPVIFFYEDPDSVRLNQPAKDELKKLSERHHLETAVRVVAVANLEDLNWWPAREIAMAVVRGEEEKANVPVLVDLTGELRRAPWYMSAKDSTVLVLSAKGEVLFRSQGKLEGKRFDRLKATLEGLLRSTASR